MWCVLQLQQTPKRGLYTKIIPEQKAEIATLPVCRSDENKTMRKFKMNIESTSKNFLIYGIRSLVLGMIRIYPWHKLEW